MTPVRCSFSIDGSSWHMMTDDCFSLKYSTKPFSEKSSRLSPAITNRSSSALSMANSRSRTAPSRPSLVVVPSSMMRIGFLSPIASRLSPLAFAHCSKMWANLWLVTTICSLIAGIWSTSSSRRSRMVESPICKRGFGKFSVSGYSRVAYPAAITILFMKYELRSSNCQLSIINCQLSITRSLPRRRGRRSKPRRCPYIAETPSDTRPPPVGGCSPPSSGLPVRCKPL